MGSTRTTKYGNYNKGPKRSVNGGSDNGSVANKIKTRKAHGSKNAITNDAIKKSDRQAKEAIDKALPKSKDDNGFAYNGRVIGRQLIRWTRK
jgi:hypothetical protein